ncbi:MAG: DUF2400 family protein [Bdellovibrionota bacterium]
MTPKKSTSALRKKLDLLYENFSREEYLQGDPLGALDRTLPWEDLEVLSFILAGLSYGRVENIYRSYRSVLARLQTLGIGDTGRGLSKWLEATPLGDQKKLLDRALKGWVHRLNSSGDLRDVILILGRARKNHGSLAETFFFGFADQPDLSPPPKQMLVAFCARLNALAPPFKKTGTQNSATAWKGTGASWFFASPDQGSTCKRLLMWLRWMSRKDSIDIGLWIEKFPERLLQENLFWPVDTHIHQWALKEGITARKSANWAFVEELTLWAKQICPEDPVRYDFVLCQSSMRRFRGKA